MATEQPNTNGHITEDEASLYDRQIRLWGLEAQNRMRSSTVLVLSLRSIAHETIKNMVLAGIGRLIIMDGEKVTEDDLGGGFLFREEEGAVGKERTEAALPQIASLNPLVSLTAFPTMAPFIGGDEASMVEFLKKEKVSVVVACDLTLRQFGPIDAAAHKAGSMFYAAGSYGLYGFVFADLGSDHEFLTNRPAFDANPGLQKKRLAYATAAAAFDESQWSLPATDVLKGGSPFRGLTRAGTRDLRPQLMLGVLALWEFEARHGSLPTGAEGQQAQLTQIAEEFCEALGISKKAVPSIDADLMEHLSDHATNYFPPTLAILGGLLAQDVLRALSHKDQPVANLLVIDSFRSISAVTSWAMGPAVAVDA